MIFQVSQLPLQFLPGNPRSSIRIGTRIGKRIGLGSDCAGFQSMACECRSGRWLPTEQITEFDHFSSLVPRELICDDVFRTSFEVHLSLMRENTRVHDSVTLLNILCNCGKSLGALYSTLYIRSKSRFFRQTLNLL